MNAKRQRSTAKVYLATGYNSEDETINVRRAMDDGRQRRNKEGHPIYSREDIREQYCINSKELGVFEDDYFQEHRLFGCLSTSHLPDKSPCNKSNSLLSCVQKRKSSVEDLQKRISDEKGGRKAIHEIEEEEDSDGGFKRRIKPRTFLISEYRSAWTHATDGRFRDSSDVFTHPFNHSNVSRYPPQKAPLQVSYSQPDATSTLVQQPYRPCLLHFDTTVRPAFATTCRSFDELNGKGRPSDWYTPETKSFESRDFWDEDSREKHVSFDSNYIVRSNTIGGGLRAESQPQQMPESSEHVEMAFGRRAFSPPVAMSLRGRNHSQERLIKAVVRQAERSISSVRSLDLAALQSTSSVYTTVSQHVHPSAFYTSSSYIPAYRFIRRAIMRTQATQTEADRKHARIIPAYLTLSPRASSKKGGRQQRYSGHYLHQYQRRFDSATDSSEKGKFVYSDESDDETLEVHLKEHKPRKAFRATAKEKGKERNIESEKPVFKSKSRSRVKAQRSVDELETMVVSKPSGYGPVSVEKDGSISRTSFEKSHSFDELENYQSHIKSEESVIVRRHSLAEDFSGEKCFTLLYPPPGFDENMDEIRKERNHRTEESPGKSSTDSSKAIYSGLTDDQHSITEIDELDSSLRSHESPTLVSELAVSEEFGKMPPFESTTIHFPRPEATKVTRRPLRVGPPQVPSTFKNGKTCVVELTSPESEASSHLTEVLSSKSEKTTSSSDHYEIVEEKQSGTGSGSSIYATATDQSPREYAKDRMDEGQTSFETASSAAASQFSSPASSGKRKSSSSGAEEQILSPDHAIEQKAIKQKSLLSPVRPQVTYPRSPKKQGRYLFPEEPRSESSEDSSTAKRERTGSPGSESMGSKSMEQLEEFDSEGIGDTTPLYELCSSDPSTAFEPTTVVERVHKDFTPEDFERSVGVYRADIETPEDEGKTMAEMEQEEPPTESTEKKVEISDTEPGSEGGGEAEASTEIELETVESDEFEGFIADEAEFALAGTAVFCRRTLSGELSTVSEVSEEMSNQKSDISDSSSSIEKPKSPAISAEAIVKEETVPKATEQTSPSSSRSTTSGSFVIDCHSEMHSLSEDVKNQRAPVKRTESLPCLATEEFTKDKEVKSGTSESTTSATVPQEENTAVSTSDKISPERAKGEVVAGQIDTAGESSQATERDVARSEFSLEQQSSQELDEESLSMGAYCVTIPPHEHSLLADSEDTSSTTTPSNQQWRWKQPDRGRGALKDGSQLKMLELVSEHSTDTDVEEKHIEKETPKIASDSQSDSSPKAADVCHLHGSLGSAEESAAKGVPCTHKFTCTQCGQAVHETTTGAIRKVKDIESTSKPCLPHVHRKSATIEDIITEKQDDEQDIGVHAEAYRSAQWFYIGSKDELIVWGHRLSPERAQEAKDSRADDVTDLEKSFRKQYDAVTHRMIHRKASIEMYRKILENSFSVEKMVNVNRSKGEFGFRIHGSRPVVVSAIEKGTPAETCGLEIGDIVVSVNGIDVLEASHSDVVRLAHSGSECLRLELVPTCHILEKSKSMDDTGTIICGYLEKKCCNILSDTQEVMWKRRWFVLKTDLYLYSYKNADETELLGAFSLQSCCASIVPGKGSEGSSTIFKISKYLESPQFFADSDEKSAVKWVNALNEASNKLSQVDPFMETTLRRIHVSPDSISNEDASGFLEKFNQRRKMWKQRYFVLKDACLYFYADRSSTTALGIFYLHGYKVQSCTMVSTKNTFEAIPPESRFRHLWLKADSELDKKKWLAALEYSIDRWLKLI